jgi:hypothetical protein
VGLPHLGQGVGGGDDDLEPVFAHQADKLQAGRRTSVRPGAGNDFQAQFRAPLPRSIVAIRSRSATNASDVPIASSAHRVDGHIDPVRGQRTDPLGEPAPVAHRAGSKLT